jgi:sugar lactone lactonase YvrE
MHKRCIVAAGVWLALALAASRALSHPGSGIAVDDQGNVSFTDTGRGVWQIANDGNVTLISEIAMHWMALDKEGAFADAPDQIGEWFGRVTPRGKKPTLLWCSDFPFTVGTDGNVYYAKMHGLTIMRRTPAGEEAAITKPEDFGFDDEHAVGVNGLACGSDGTLYLVMLDDLHQSEASADHWLWAVDRNGDVRLIAKNFIPERIPPSERHHEAIPEYCRGLAVDDADNVYVAATGSRCVLKVAPTGDASVVLRCDKPWSPTGVATADGAVYVLEYDDETPTEGRNWPPRVRKLSSDGNVSILMTVNRDDASQ